MSHIRRINSLHSWPIHCLRISSLRTIRRRALRLVVVVPKHTRPLLHRLLVVLRPQRGVCAAVVDLHPRAGAAVTRVHGFCYAGPVGGRADRVSLRARAVPGCDTAGRRDEAAGGHAGVGNGGLEDVGVCGGQDVLRRRQYSCEVGVFFGG